MPRARQPDRYRQTSEDGTAPNDHWAALDGHAHYLPPPGPPGTTVPVWLAIVVVAILSVSMFLAGFLAGSRTAPQDTGTLPVDGRFSFEADSGKLPLDEPER